MNKKRYTLFKHTGEWSWSSYEEKDNFKDWEVYYEFDSKYGSYLQIAGAGLFNGVYMIYDNKENKRIIAFRGGSLHE